MTERSEGPPAQGSLPRFRPRQVRKDPPCSCGCPNGTDIRGWVAIVAQRRILGLSRDQAYARAWRRLVDVNPFPSVLGRVCPHPCQDGCTRGRKDGALQIRALERFLGDRGLEMGLALPRLDLEPGKESVGVIGSGPAGLSCAYQLARRGYAVTVYEGAARPGGMLRYGIPDYRLPPEILDREIDRILELGVELRTGTAVGEAVSLEEVRERHDVVFLGIGAHAGRWLGIPGEDDPGVWTGTDYLRRANEGSEPVLGGTVAVIGGGNTAVDAARMARRQGAEVVVVYRRGRREMPAFDDEVDEMLAEGVRLELLSQPVAVHRNGSRPAALLVQRMELAEADAGGRRSPRPIEGDLVRLPVDAVIVAVSQQPRWKGLVPLNPSGGWVRVEGRGRLLDDVWVGGDVRGPGFASLAVAQGRKAAEEIHDRLRGRVGDVAEESLPLDPGGVKIDLYPPRDPVRPASLTAAQALASPTAEVVETIGEEEFLREVDRCFSCGLCFGCNHCWMFCSSGGFSPLREQGPGAYFALSLDLCESCGKCVDLCPCGYLEFC